MPYPASAVCKNCGHTNGWHLHLDGPHSRVCNKPKCKCDNFEVAD